MSGAPPVRARWLRRAALLVLALVALAALGAGAFALAENAAYDASVAKVYDIAPVPLARSLDPAVVARGAHLARSLAPCAVSGCHGADLGGGHVSEAGPVARVVAPNASLILPAYSDAELARLIRHGVKKDGRTVRFMIADSFSWLPDADVVALISYLRTVPPIDRVNDGTVIAPFGKVLDRLGYVPIDIARRIDHDRVGDGPAPAATADYGRWIARMCNGCHGANMSGGPLPGLPPGFPVPLNLTPHATGLGGWTYDDFVGVIESGKRRDGRPLDGFMPIEVLRGMDDTERRALWAYLQSLPPRAFGER